MNEFYVTFGNKYRHGHHPTIPQAHPDGWLVIEADSYNQARQVVYTVAEGHWAMLYTSPEFELINHLFPAGELLRVTQKEVR